MIMVCLTELYAKTDVTVELSICDPAELNIADIQSMSITLLNEQTGLEISLSSLDNEIEIGVGGIFASISKTQLTDAGKYNLRITFVDGAGKTRGLTPDPSFLEFK